MIVYLHGFNSSPQSHKAQLLQRYMVGRGLGAEFACPRLPPSAIEAIRIAEALGVGEHVCYLGAQRNLYSGEAYELTEAHLDEWRALYVPKITSSRYLLIVETGDEVLDYRRAVQRYAGAEQEVVPGGDHSLQSFPRHLARILNFAGY